MGPLKFPFYSRTRDGSSVLNPPTLTSTLLLLALALELAIALATPSLALAAQPAYPSVPVDMQARQVSEHVYYVQGVARIATDNAGFVSNAAFIVTSEGVVVFDTLGTPPLGYMLLEVIRGITDAPVVRVYNSHYHADHMYGNQVFLDLGATITAPRGAEDYLQGETAQLRLQERRSSLGQWVTGDTRLVVPGHYLETDETFTLGGVTLRAVNLGSAHSDGDLILFVETDKVLLSGDMIFEGRVPFLGSANSGSWLEILEQLSITDVAAVIPGHGKATDNPQQIIDLTRRYLAHVRNVMQDAVDNWIPFEEAYDAADWGEFENLPTFEDANRRNAYGVYLSLEQESLE